MYRIISPVNLLVLFAALICWHIIITTGRPTPKESISEEFLGLSKAGFKKYQKKTKQLKILMAAFNKIKINKKHLTPEFDDMFLPLDVVDTLIKRYKLLLKERKNTRPKRKIFEFKIFKSDKKWNVAESNPIKYIILGFSEEAQADIDRAFQYWEKHTCIRLKKVVTIPVKEHHIQIVGAHSGLCSSFVGKEESETRNYQLIYLGLEKCKPLMGFAIHEIGHALGLVHEQNKYNAKKHIVIHRENIEAKITNYYPIEGVVSLGVPYDLNSIMHYDGFQGAISSDPTITTHDPLYQKNIGQRVELSFLDKKIVNLEYCKDSCPKILPCNRSGYTDPNNCAQCVCPDGFGGRLCDTVGDVHHKACQKPQIIKVTDAEQCITMKPYKPFTECHWHLQAGSGQKIAVYFKNDFSVYCDDAFSCFHWVEIKYKGDYSMPGPRFCCQKTPKAKMLSDTEKVVVSFKSNFKDENVNSTTTKGFQLCFKLSSCSENEVLKCDTLHKWNISTEPELEAPETFRQAISGCSGEVKARKKIKFIIKLVGGHSFKIDKLCLNRPGSRAVVLMLELTSSAITTVPMLGNIPCMDANTFTHVGPVKKLTIEVQSRGEMSVSDIMIEVCKQ